MILVCGAGSYKTGHSSSRTAKPDGCCNSGNFFLHDIDMSVLLCGSLRKVHVALQKVLAQSHIVSAALIWRSSGTKIVVSSVMSKSLELG